MTLLDHTINLMTKYSAYIWNPITPQILSNIPASIETCLSNLLSTEIILKESTTHYKYIFTYRYVYYIYIYIYLILYYMTLLNIYIYMLYMYVYMYTHIHIKSKKPAHYLGMLSLQKGKNIYLI